MTQLFKNSNSSKLTKRARVAYDLHKYVPADWYEKSVQDNIFQRFWHWRRKVALRKMVRDMKGIVLDVGSCDGYFTHEVLTSSKASKIIGIDVLKHAVAYAQERYKDIHELSFQFGEAHHLDFPDCMFDNVVCLEALEHVEDPRIVLREMKRVLKKDGSIYILIPAENLLFQVIWPLWTLWRGRIWKGSHLHQYKKNQVISYIQDAGFEVRKNHTFLWGMLQFVHAQRK